MTGGGESSKTYLTSSLPPPDAVFLNDGELVHFHLSLLKNKSTVIGAFFDEHNDQKQIEVPSTIDTSPDSIRVALQIIYSPFKCTHIEAMDLIEKQTGRLNMVAVGVLTFARWLNILDIDMFVKRYWDDSAMNTLIELGGGSSSEEDILGIQQAPNTDTIKTIIEYKDLLPLSFKQLTRNIPNMSFLARSRVSLGFHDQEWKDLTAKIPLPLPTNSIQYIAVVGRQIKRALELADLHSSVLQSRFTAMKYKQCDDWENTCDQMVKAAMKHQEDYPELSHFFGSSPCDEYDEKIDVNNWDVEEFPLGVSTSFCIYMTVSVGSIQVTVIVYTGPTDDEEEGNTLIEFCTALSCISVQGIDILPDTRIPRTKVTLKSYICHIISNNIGWEVVLGGNTEIMQKETMICMFLIAFAGVVRKFRQYKWESWKQNITIIVKNPGNNFSLKKHFKKTIKNHSLQDAVTVNGRLAKCEIIFI